MCHNRFHLLILLKYREINKHFNNILIHLQCFWTHQQQHFPFYTLFIYMIEEILKRENPGQLVVSLDNLRTVIHKIQVEAAQDTSLSKMAQVLPTPNHEDRYLTREEAAEFCHVSKIPQKTVMAQITQNDLQGSKRLYNLFDSVFAIGQSAKDEDLRYIKEEIAKTIEDLRKKGVSYRSIDEQLSIPKSTVESIDKRTRRKKARK